MYAVIKTGGKQYRVEKGQHLDVEVLPDQEAPSFTPILLVDGEKVIHEPSKLASAAVTAEVVGETKGPKITGFTYKNKSNERRRWGHRQRYTTIRITDIKKTQRSAASRASAKKELKDIQEDES